MTNMIKLVRCKYHPICDSPAWDNPENMCEDRYTGEYYHNECRPSVKEKNPIITDNTLGGFTQEIQK